MYFNALNVLNKSSSHFSKLTLHDIIIHTFSSENLYLGAYRQITNLFGPYDKIQKYLHLKGSILYAL